MCINALGDFPMPGETRSLETILTRNTLAQILEIKNTAYVAFF